MHHLPVEGASTAFLAGHMDHLDALHYLFHFRGHFHWTIQTVRGRLNELTVSLTSLPTRLWRNESVVDLKQLFH